MAGSCGAVSAGSTRDHTSRNSATGAVPVVCTYIKYRTIFLILLAKEVDPRGRWMVVYICT